MQMNYHRRIELEIEPVSSPQIIRNCSKCGGKSHFSNTGNFRVNANGNCIDIWLIYACCQCKTTYNMTLFERISPNELRKEAYEQFLANDKSLAMSYGCDNQIFRKNKVEVDWENITYIISEKILEEEYQENQAFQEHQNVLKIKFIYPLKIRIDKLFAEYFNISRTKVKQLIEEKMIMALDSCNTSKKYIIDGMEFIVKLRF